MLAAAQNPSGGGVMGAMLQAGHGRRPRPAAGRGPGRAAPAAGGRPRRWGRRRRCRPRSPTTSRSTARPAGPLHARAGRRRHRVGPGHGDHAGVGGGHADVGRCQHHPGAAGRAQPAAAHAARWCDAPADAPVGLVSDAPPPPSRGPDRAPRLARSPAADASAGRAGPSSSRPRAPGTYPCQACGGTMMFDATTQKLKCQSCGTRPRHRRRPRRAAVAERDFATGIAALVAQAARPASPAPAVGREGGRLPELRRPHHLHRHPHRHPLPLLRHADPARRRPRRPVPPGRRRRPPLRRRREARPGQGRELDQQPALRPSEFKKYKQTGSFSSVYAAYFTYDAATSTWYRGERGRRYTVTVGSGDNQRTETRTDWTPVQGQVANDFDDLTVLANTGFEGDKVKAPRAMADPAGQAVQRPVRGRPPVRAPTTTTSSSASARPARRSTPRCWPPCGGTSPRRRPAGPPARDHLPPAHLQAPAAAHLAADGDLRRQAVPGRSSTASPARSRASGRGAG